MPNGEKTEEMQSMSALYKNAHQFCTLKLQIFARVKKKTNLHHEGEEPLPRSNLATAEVTNFPRGEEGEAPGMQQHRFKNGPAISRVFLTATADA